jgi:dipeptidyl aminopeptidase/acylaminoacyl peptidase
MVRQGMAWWLVLVLAAPLTGQDPQPVAIEDLFRIASVGAPVVSPDGEWVAYTVTTTDYDEDERETRLWMVAWAGGEALPMTLEGTSVGSPAWSPDGAWLTFLDARNEGETQVWGLDRRGGEARPLTSVEAGVDDYLWSPDGSRLLLWITDPEPSDSADDDDTETPHVIDRLQFKQDYAGYLDRRRRRLHVWDLEADTMVRLTAGDYDDGSAAWSPDGRQVVFASNRTEEPDANDNTDLWIVDVPAEIRKPEPDSAASAEEEDGAAEPVAVPPLRRLTTNPGADANPVWSPDGATIAYVSVTRPERLWYATQHAAAISPDGGEPRLLTGALDRNVQDVRFGPDGDVWFRVEDSGEHHLARVGAGGGPIERVIAGEQVVSAYGVGGGRIALRLESVHRPYEVFALDGDGPRRLTHVNDAVLAGLALGDVVNIHASSTEGTEVEGWVVLPPDYEPGVRYPTLLRIHGGPTAQYDVGFDFEAQLFASNGYVVVKSNPRGSTGYGSDFSHAIFADWGNRDFHDVMAAVDRAIALGYADPDRLGVGGWSYGGILTNYVITRSDRFEGAITGASEVLYRSNYGHDHYQRVWVEELGLPWGETAENWERISPFNDVERIVTPTLIMGGAEDWNVPILNSEQLYQALKKIGRVPTVLIVYPDEHHGIRDLRFQKDRLERYLDWYDWFVKGEREPEALRAEWEGALPVR